MTLFNENVNSRAARGRMAEPVIAGGGGLYRQITPPMKKKQ